MQCRTLRVDAPLIKLSSSGIALKSSWKSTFCPLLATARGASPLFTPWGGTGGAERVRAGSATWFVTEMELIDERETKLRML